jgi:hypothetical protein
MALQILQKALQNALDEFVIPLKLKAKPSVGLFSRKSFCYIAVNSIWGTQHGKNH